MIRLALNQDSCDLDLFEFINRASDFQAVELNQLKIEESLISIDLKDILEILETYSLKVASIFRLEDFSLCSNKKFNSEIISTLEKMLEYCYKLETNLLIVNPSIIDLEIPRWKLYRRTRKKLKEICKLAYEYDVKVGLEFLNLPNSSIPSLKEAKELMKPLEYIENLGYVIDSFHFAKSQGDLEELYEVRKLIYLVQLSDLSFNSLKSQREITSLDDDARVFPGKGDYNLQKFISYLQRIGYYDYFSLELYKKPCSPNYYGRFRRKYQEL